jgi:hypothetical protein
MEFRLALISALVCGAFYGCATPADESGAKAPASGAQTAAPSPNANGTYRTGSRLPQYDSDGSSSTGSASKDDYEDARRGAPNPYQRN